MEEIQPAEIEFSESEQADEMDDHIPLGELKKTQNDQGAKDASSQDRPAPMFLVMEGRRNNLSPKELAIMNAIEKRTGRPQ